MVGPPQVCGVPAGNGMQVQASLGSLKCLYFKPTSPDNDDTQTIYSGFDHGRPFISGEIHPLE